jgi:hypothetical protein
VTANHGATRATAREINTRDYYMTHNPLTRKFDQKLINRLLKKVVFSSIVVPAAVYGNSGTVLLPIGAWSRASPRS